MATDGIADGAGEQASASARAPSRTRPIDLVHLARQTLGDSDLECQVLSMFLHQADSVCERIASADETETRRLAHGLIGSARGVGAFALADCAAEIEDRPSRPGALERLSALIEDVRAFVGGITR